MRRVTFLVGLRLSEKGHVVLAQVANEYVRLTAVGLLDQRKAMGQLGAYRASA